MTVYHFNRETGKSGPCKAKNKCPLGANAEHFNGKEELNVYIQTYEEK